MERKQFRTVATKVVDSAKGIVKAFFAVMGNVDLGNDRIWPGAFTKTFSERGLSVKVLDAHRTDSGLAAIGRPLELREVGRDELPPELLARFPDATGAAEATVQFLMETPEGKGIFTRLKEAVLDQWSFAYDTIQHDFSEEMSDGKNITVRNLRELKLFELSPVLFGMNPATMTTGAKADGSNPDAKPWASFPIADEFCVFRINEQNERMGESLGCHATQAEAEAQVRALFASEEDAGKDEDPELMQPEDVFTPPQRGRIRDIVMDVLNEQIETDNAPALDVRAAETDQEHEQAGPDIPPTSEVTLAEVEVMLAEVQMELLEVE